jgi:lipopolysaccharide/colanic/teichoic acid biosynthesis glycosyltransferase
MDTIQTSLTIKQIFIKRLFDLLLSSIGLLILTPFIIIVWVILSISLLENGFFFQIRVGKNGKLFNIIKFKTMNNFTSNTSSITSHNDLRITKLGSFLRKTKIDEIPQLWNVFVGKMSFVGPRPDVPGYADMLDGKDRLILSVKPGITGPAQIFYSNEAKILSKQTQIKDFNDNVIWPNKVKINLEYIENYSFQRDVYYIWKTII